MDDSLKMPNKQDFLAQLESSFKLDYEGVKESLTLIEVSSVVAEKIEESQDEPFSLVFQSASTNVLGQGVYPLLNEGMGELNIFLVPISADETSVQYEAIFT